MFTDYELGAVKAIPYKVHLALDAIGAAALAATPFVTGQYKKGRREWLPHVGLALFELTSLVMSDPTGRGNYHGDVEAVQEANSDDPLRKIHDGGPAVVTASAVLRRDTIRVWLSTRPTSRRWATRGVSS